MRAAVLKRYGAPLEIGERPDPVPGPGQVVLDVAACGVCGSDRFLQAGGFDSTLPIVPGHEAAGYVRAIGQGVTGLAEGMLAAIYYIQSCGACVRCRDGRPNLCLDLSRMGVDTDGAFATQVVVPATSVLPVDPSLDPAVLAVLTDAVGTGYHALTRIARLQAGERVVVFGVGGIGSNVVQLARHLGGRVLAVSRRAHKLQLARELGAEATVTDADDTAGAIAEWAGPGGPELVIQTVGDPKVDRRAVEVAGVGARVVFVGASTGPFEVRATELIWRELRLLGSRGFTPDDIREVVALEREGVLRTDHLISKRRPLAEVNDALQDLADGAVLRTVIEPDR